MAASKQYPETETAPAQLLPILLGILQHHLEEIPGPEQYDADLTALGVDSLMAIDIAHHLEEELGIVIDDREALGFRSVNAICASLRRRAVSACDCEPGSLR
jgi:acyl carrier protein